MLDGFECCRRSDGAGKLVSDLLRGLQVVMFQSLSVFTAGQARRKRFLCTWQGVCLSRRALMLEFEAKLSKMAVCCSTMSRFRDESRVRLQRCFTYP